MEVPNVPQLHGATLLEARLVQMTHAHCTSWLRTADCARDASKIRYSFQRKPRIRLAVVPVMAQRGVKDIFMFAPILDGHFQCQLGVR
jgi:hypothetical protein